MISAEVKQFASLADVVILAVGFSPSTESEGLDRTGETKRVTVSLDARSFSYWDEAKHGWTIDPGKFVIHVGDSSEKTPLHADLTIN